MTSLFPWWDTVAAPLADHVQPVHLSDDGTLTVLCTSNPWHTGIRLMADQLVGRIQESGINGVTRIRAILPPLRVLITGSRTWSDHEAIADALLDTWHDLVQDCGSHWKLCIIHGDAAGADRIAGQWGTTNGHLVHPVPADWGTCADNCPPDHMRPRRDGTLYCPTAGPRRNQQMVDMGADLCLAFIRNGSAGANDCARRAEAAGIPTRRFTE